MIVLFQFFNHFLCRFASIKIFTVGKTPSRVTALQVVKTSFLGPSPRLSPPPLPHPWEDQYYRITCNYETIDLRHQYGIIVSEAQALSWRNVPSGARGE